MPSKATGPIVILNYSGYSDADSKHRPSGAQWQRCDPDWVKKVYLSKVAQKWMEDTGQAEAGRSALPYDCFFALFLLLLSFVARPCSFHVYLLSRILPEGSFIELQLACYRLLTLMRSDTLSHPASSAISSYDPEDRHHLASSEISGPIF